MSAIGNYVHYQASNYMKYGIRKKSESEKKVDVGLWKDIRNNIYKKIVDSKKYSKDDIKDIQDKYNAYRKMVTTTDKNEMSKVKEKIISLMMKKFNNINEKTIFNFETGNVYQPLDQASVENQIANFSNNIKKIKKDLITDKKKQVATKQVTMKVIDQFIVAYNNLEGIDNATKRESAKNLLKKVEETFFDLVVIEDKWLKSENLTGVHKSVTNVTLQTYNDAIDLIRTLIGIKDASKLGSAKGAFEEYIGAAAALAAEGEAAGVLAEDLEEYILKHLENKIKQGGSKKTKGTIQSDLAAISQTVAKTLKNNDFIYQDADGKYHYQIDYESDQKMDVSFLYDPVNNKTASLSIKNYNLGSGYPISLVTKSPLSTFLFNMGNVNHTNHFLNIFAKHESIIPSTFRKCRKIAEESLAYYLLWAAMSGKGVGKSEGTADIFVVNDNRNKDCVKMWDIGELVDNIIKKGNLEEDLIIKEPLSSLYLKNDWVKSGKSIGDNIQQRISKLIIDCHAHKITVHINPKVLKY